MDKMDRMVKARSYGHIPLNIGYDPYWGIRLMCRCGSVSYLFHDRVKYWERGGYDGLVSGDVVGGRCGGCRRVGVRFVDRWLSRAEAFHKNDIRFRGNNIDKGAAVNI